MGFAYTAYELEKLVEMRQRETRETSRRNSLRSLARSWVLSQSLLNDRESELSRHSGGRG